VNAGPSAMRAAALQPGGRAADRRGIGVLALGHGCVDVAQGAVPALLPFLHHARGYNYAAGAALVLAMTITSSLIQPLFGHLADRRSLPWLLPGGVALAGVGISLAGAVRSYPLTFAAVAIAGAGVGAYHPEAARYANYVSSSARRASGMSLFSVGGNVGFALGPILVTPLVLALGLGGTLWLLAVYAAVALVLALSLAHLNSFRPERAVAGGRTTGSAGGDRWGPFALVAGVASFRSCAYFGLQAFIPAYLIARYHAAAGVGNAALATMLAAGALGTLVGGRLGDRIGLRPILVACMAALPPLVALLLLAGRDADFALLAAIGFFTVGNFSTTVVLGQRFLPSRIGIASGVTLGAAIGVGGVCAALLGLLADAAGLTAVIALIAVLPLGGLGCALLIPREPAPGAPRSAA
jgi:FSR family fosmidomycin resistance protein-like MFS transporter